MAKQVAGKLSEKVQSALLPLYGRSASEGLNLEVVPPNRLTGTLVSAKFRGLTHGERQDLIWDLLDEVLTPHERTRIVIIIANTPEEHRIIRKRSKSA